MIPLHPFGQSAEQGVGPLSAFTPGQLFVSDAPSRRAVLVVDDDHEIRGVLRELLGDEGYHVYEAANGAEGLKLLEAAEAPLDLMMPGIDGFEVCRRLASDARLRDGHAVVLMSARRNLEAADHTAVRATISKPFEVYDLLDLVEQLATQSTAPQAGDANDAPAAPSDAGAAD